MLTNFFQWYDNQTAITRMFVLGVSVASAFFISRGVGGLIW